MNKLISRIKESIESKNYSEAEQLSWDLYKSNNNDYTAIKTLGLCLLLQNKFYGSIDMYERVENKAKDDFDVINNLGHLYLKIEDFQKSEDAALRATTINPSSHLPYVTLLDLNLRKRDFEAAYNFAATLLQKIDFKTLLNNPNITYLVFDAYVASQKKDDANKLLNYFYNRIFNPEVFYYHSSYEPETINKEIEKKANELLETASFDNPITKSKTLGPIHFGLAKLYEKKGNMELSDDHYSKANNFITDLIRYHPMTNQKMIKNIKNIFSNYEAQQFNFIEHHKQNLIFIIGMPRSGTTLVESIIGSSNLAISGGELRSMYELFKKYYDDEDTDFIETTDPGLVYLDRIKYIRKKQKYFIDKLPGNIYNVGFIKKIFPDAKIIYMKRDPWDNAISIYKQFYVANIPYSSTFFNTGIIYANHEEIMRFWIKEKNIDILTVTYEDLVKNTKDWANRIYDYCNIDEKYDSFNRKQFFSRTASKNQVTKDVHTRSIGKSSFENKKDDFLKSLENQRFFWNKK